MRALFQHSLLQRSHTEPQRRKWFERVCLDPSLHSKSILSSSVVFSAALRSLREIFRSILFLASPQRPSLLQRFPIRHCLAVRVLDMRNELIAFLL
jgi:hypothetical protein